MKKVAVPPFLFAMCIGLVLAGTVSGPASAAGLKVTPSIEMDGRYDSNIFNSSTGEESDYVFRATPRLTLTVEGFESSIDLSGGFDIEKYAEHSELDKTIATKNFDLKTGTPLKITPQFTLRPSARYIESRDAYRRNALTMTTDPALPPSETVVTGRTNVREFAGSLQAIYQFTPNLDLEVGGGGTKRSFTEQAQDLVDSSTLEGNASISYRVTPRVSTGIFFDTSHNSFEGRPSSRIYSMGLTGRYAFTENYSLDVRAGASLLEKPAAIGDRKDDSWAPYGRLSLSYVWKTFRAAILGSYAYAGGGSSGITTKRGNIVLSLSDQITEEWGWDFAASYQSNESAYSSVQGKVSTEGANAGIRYRPAEWSVIRLWGNTFRQRDRGISGISDVTRSSVMLGLYLGNTYNIF